jgi:hypothetical protein
MTNACDPREDPHTGDVIRCEGAGRISGFNHYADGVCFACKGEGNEGARPMLAALKTLLERFIIEDCRAA